MSEVSDYWKPELARSQEECRRIGLLAGEQRAEIERLRREVDDAKADALRMHGEKMRYFDALLEMRCFDDRNGSLHQNYRDIIDRALGDEQKPST